MTNLSQQKQSKPCTGHKFIPWVITLNGPLRVDKTTLLNELAKLLPNSYIIPEYIDVLEDVDYRLNDYLEGLMPSYNFQDYILECYDSMTYKLIISHYDYIFVERSPVEGILFFAKLELDGNRHTEA